MSSPWVQLSGTSAPLLKVRGAPGLEVVDGGLVVDGEVVGWYGVWFARPPRPLGVAPTTAGDSGIKERSSSMGWRLMGPGRRSLR
jgi:hypothetical protein